MPGPSDPFEKTFSSDRVREPPDPIVMDPPTFAQFAGVLDTTAAPSVMEPGKLSTVATSRERPWVTSIVPALFLRAPA